MNKDVNIENSIIADILNNPHLFHEAIDLLTPDNFYNSRCRIIYNEMMEVTVAGLEIDLVTLTERLKGIIKATAIIDILDSGVGVSNFKERCLLVKENWLSREMADLSVRIKQKVDNSEDPLDLLHFLEEEHSRMSDSVSIGSMKSNSSIFDSVLTKYDHVKRGGLLGISTGIKKLDEITYGLQDGQLYLVAARPSIGKSVLLSNIGTHVAKKGIPVAFFNFEMSEGQIMSRIVCSELKIPSTALKTGSLTKEQEKKLRDSKKFFSSLPFYIIKTAGSTPGEVLAKSKKLVREKGIGLILVDYLQLMSYPKAGNREQEINKIAEELKKMSENLSIPVVAAAQLNRAVEYREDKKPMLADLRESGGLEAHSDVAILIHRPEFYGIPEFYQGMSSIGAAEFIVAKNRDGKPDNTYVTFLSEYLQFANYTKREFDI